jgi:probable HAF family extracellular repeat protein
MLMQHLTSVAAQTKALAGNLAGPTNQKNFKEFIKSIHGIGRFCRRSRVLALMLVVGLASQSLLSAVMAQSYTITDLGTLGGFNSVANAVNGSGQVVGYAYTATGLSHAYLYTGPNARSWYPRRRL